MPHKNKEDRQQYNREYNARPEVKRRRVARNERPENRLKIARRNKAWYAVPCNRVKHDAYSAEHRYEWRDIQRSKLGTTPKPENSRCPICQQVKDLQWDHDPKTGLFRGWICSLCNSGLGHFGDGPTILSRALDYLTQGRVT